MNNDRFPTEVCNQAPGKRSSNSDYLIAYSRSIIYENELTKCWRRRRWSGTRTHKDCFMTQTHHQNNRCPVDDGGSRHQALGDAGVNTSLQVVFNIGKYEILRGTRAATLEATAERTERGCLPNSLHIQQIHAG
ncbi:uncharacterized protein [Lolium perenne]|uniref:uncharacterized protein isoform X3 n=1 Tax=Lolium perenne TaxID=4522 RepID=UPI003A99A059